MKLKRILLSFLVAIATIFSGQAQQLGAEGVPFRMKGRTYFSYPIILPDTVVLNGNDTARLAMAGPNRDLYLSYKDPDCSCAKWRLAGFAAQAKNGIRLQDGAYQLGNDALTDDNVYVHMGQGRFMQLTDSAQGVFLSIGDNELYFQALNAGLQILGTGEEFEATAMYFGRSRYNGDSWNLDVDFSPFTMAGAHLPIVRMTGAITNNRNVEIADGLFINEWFTVISSSPDDEGYHWIPTGTPVYDATGASIPYFEKDVVYTFMWNGSIWKQINIGITSMPGTIYNSNGTISEPREITFTDDNGLSLSGNGYGILLNSINQGYGGAIEGQSFDGIGVAGGTRNGIGVLGVVGGTPGYTGVPGQFVRVNSTSNNTTQNVTQFVAKYIPSPIAAPAAGFGTELQFLVTDGDMANAGVLAGRLKHSWTDVTHATRTSKVTLTGLSAGTETDWLTLIPNYQIVNAGADTLATRSWARTIGSIFPHFTVNAGDTSGGYVPLVFGVDDSTIAIPSLKAEGADGIDVTVVPTGTDKVLITVAAPTLARFLSGDYADRPVSAVPGQTFYQEDQLEGLYLWDGSGWRFQPDGNTEVFSKMHGNTYPMNQNSSGTGAGNFQSDAYFSRWRMETGTDAAGISQLRTSQNMLSTMPTAGKLIWYYSGVRIGTLSDGTNTFTIRVGQDAAADGLGLQFKYTHSNSSGQWECISHDGTTATTVASGVTVANNTDYEMIIVLDYAGTDNAKFYINGALVATITTNLPTSLTNSYQGSTSIQKSAGSTNRNFLVDDIIIKQIP